MCGVRVVVTRAGAGRNTRLAMRGVVSLVVAVLAAAVAPADAHAQRGGDGARSGAVATACPGDIPGIRRGLTNIMQVNSAHWLRQRRRLGLTDAEGAEVRVLGDRAVDATVCRRLIARLSRAHRARRDGRPRYDIVFFQVGDRYVIALREARAERRLGVPQMPDRAITFDLSLNRLVEHTWP